MSDRGHFTYFSSGIPFIIGFPSSFGNIGSEIPFIIGFPYVLLVSNIQPVLGSLKKTTAM